MGLVTNPGMAKWLWLSALVVALDQGTKWLALNALEPYTPMPVVPFFNLTLMFNEGAAFSFLSDAGGWQRWFFVGLAVAMAAVLTIWLLRLGRREQLTGAALSLVIGGALGNLIDRLLLGRVTDFIDLYVGAWHWPAFNIADSAITVGVVLLLLTNVREQSSEQQDP